MCADGDSSLCPISLPKPVGRWPSGAALHSLSPREVGRVAGHRPLPTLPTPFIMWNVYSTPTCRAPPSKELSAGLPGGVRAAYRGGGAGGAGGRMALG